MGQPAETDQTEISIPSVTYTIHIEILHIIDIGGGYSDELYKPAALLYPGGPPEAGQPLRQGPRPPLRPQVKPCCEVDKSFTLV